jgi:hypothetical protein
MGQQPSIFTTSRLPAPPGVLLHHGGGAVGSREGRLATKTRPMMMLISVNDGELFDLIGSLLQAHLEWVQLLRSGRARSAESLGSTV